MSKHFVRGYSTCKLVAIVLVEEILVKMAIRK